MAEQPIKKTDIIEGNIFSDLIKEADIVIAKENELIATNKKLLQSYRDIANSNLGNDSKSLIENANNTKKAEVAIKSLTDSELYLVEVKTAKTKLQQEEIKLNNALEREQKKLQKSLTDLNGEYRKGVNDLNQLKKQLKELEFTGRTNGKLYKSLTNEFNTLDAKVRKAEKSVGEFNRNVGNYPKALENIGGKLAAAFSVGAVVEFGKKILDTRAEFQKFEAVLTNTLGSSAAATKSMEMIQQIAAKTPFSVKELTESYVKLVNQGFKPTSSEITKLGDLAASQGKSFDQLTEGIIDAQTGEFERLKEFGIRASKEGDKVKFTFKGVQTQTDFNSESIRKYVLSLGDLEGVSGGMAAIADTLGGKVSNLGDNFDAFFNNLGKNSEGVFAFFLDQFNDFLGLINESQTQIIKINDALKAGGSKQSFIDSFFGGNTQLVALQQNLTTITNSGKSYVEIQKDLGKALEIVNKQYQNGTITTEEYKNSLILVGQAIKNEKEATDASTNSKKANTGATKEQIKAEKDLQNQLEKLRIENTELDKRREEDNAKNENRLAKEQLEQSKGNEKTKAKIRVELDEKLRQDLLAIDDKYKKQDKERLEKENEDKIKAQQEADKKLTDSIDKQTDNANKLYEERTAKEAKRAKDRKDKRDAERKEMLEFEQQLIDAVAQAEAAKSQERQDAFDKQITDTEQNIETQRRLAEKGKANTLAEEEARKAQLERQKQIEKEEEIKRQKVLAFFKLYSAYAENDPDNALQKALKDTILAEVVAAAFIDGTENVAQDPQFSKHKYKNGQDGYIARFDGRERILNPDQNAKIGNMSNDDLANLAYMSNRGLLETAKYAAIPSNSFADNVANSALLMETVALKKEMQEIKEAIKSRPVSNFTLDGYGNFISETIENGFKKITTHKIKKPRLG